jgi:hypothetical protein
VAGANQYGCCSEWTSEPQTEALVGCVGSGEWASSLQEAGIKAFAWMLKSGPFSANQGGTTGFSSLFTGEGPFLIGFKSP